jgi:hypothetical protein
MDHFVLPAVHLDKAVCASVKSTAADPVNMTVPLSCKAQDVAVNFGKYITFHLEPQDNCCSHCRVIPSTWHCKEQDRIIRKHYACPIHHSSPVIQFI